MFSLIVNQQRLPLNIFVFERKIQAHQQTIAGRPIFYVSTWPQTVRDDNLSIAIINRITIQIRSLALPR